MLLGSISSSGGSIRSGMSSPIENSDFLALKERQEEGRVRSLFPRMRNRLGFEGIWLIWHQDTFRATATDSDNQRYNFIYDRQRYGIKFQVDKETQREIFRHILDADFDESIPVMLTQILMAPSLLTSSSVSLMTTRAT